MRYDFVVLGATGLQGRIVSKYLLKKGYRVLLCGRDKSKLSSLLKRFNKATFTSFSAEDIKATTRILKNSQASVAINCVEGDWNIHILKACMKACINYIDLGSDINMTKEQLSYFEDFRKHNLVGITGCGSVPGVGNVMLRYVKEKFDTIKTIEIGFAWNSNIKKFVVPFSMQSIMEEFTGKADVIINKKKIKVNPQSTLRKEFHKGSGEIMCFNVGHHPETFTIYEFCKDKGVRNIKFYAGFPEHSYKTISSLVDLGFASKDKIYIRGCEASPVRCLTEVLKKLETPKGYKETENLYVYIEGKKNGKNKRIEMECIVPTLKGWEDAGCNIDTGIPASIVAEMIKKEIITEKGFFSPEFIIPPKEFFEQLSKYKMVVYENKKRIN